MKTALLHYWLTNMRGGEKVLEALAEMFPQADIYTHAFGEMMRESGNNWHGHSVRESFIAHLPFARRFPQGYVWAMPYASKALNLSEYELLISSESGPIKGITKRSDQRHICYCHTPMRYIWDMYDEYYESAGFIGKAAMKMFRSHLQYHDLKSADSVDLFIANSAFVADRIKRIYNRDSIVVHPPVNVEFFGRDEIKSRARDYYLFVGASVKYKRLDLAKSACERMGRKLLVANNGKYSDEDLRELYAGAKALIFPGTEDFGIVPVEAQAAGTPVIAFNKGGALETVIDGKTGMFFDEQTVESLCGAIEEFEGGKLGQNDIEIGRACRENAARFAKKHFVSEMTKIIQM